VIGTRDIVELKACLEYLLEYSTVKVIKTGGKNYDVRTGSEVSRSSDYMVACLVGRSQGTTTASGDVESTSHSTTSNHTGGFSQTLNTTTTTQLTFTAKVAKTTTKTTTTVSTTTRTTTSSTTTTSDAVVRSRCLPQVGSGCPEGFYPVDNNNCLNVFPHPLPRDYSSLQCDNFDVRLIYHNKAIKPCLKDLLDNRTIKVIQVYGRYYDVPTGKGVSRTSNYMVACLVDKRQLVKPTITEFYIESRQPHMMKKTVLIGVAMARCRT
jgi:hypothetical protein